MPYLDHDLYDFLTSLPLEHVVDGQFHDRAILTAHPRYAHLPFEDKKKRPVPDRQYLQKATLEHARYVLLGTAGPMIRRSGLLIRLLRCVIDKRFQDQILGFGPIALYLQQIAGLDS
jgi:hypothetical protein